MSSTLFTPFCDNPKCPCHQKPYLNVENVQMVDENGKPYYVLRDVFDVPVTSVKTGDIIGTRTLAFCSICSAAVQLVKDSMVYVPEPQEQANGQEKA